MVNIAIMIWSASETFQISYCDRPDDIICDPNDLETNDIIIYPLKVLDIITILSMIGSAITFFIANRMDPGQVTKSCDFKELLQIGNDRSIDLENFCFYCQLIKSTRTFHCMVCNKCVEKFDHHCVYINNCLGYRNHKYFMFFLLFITIYIVSSSIARIIAYFMLDVN